VGAGMRAESSLIDVQHIRITNARVIHVVSYARTRPLEDSARISSTVPSRGRGSSSCKQRGILRRRRFDWPHIRPHCVRVAVTTSREGLTGENRSLFRMTYGTVDAGHAIDLPGLGWRRRHDGRACYSINRREPIRVSP
jgi:hypothetical protein